MYKQIKRWIKRQWYKLFNYGELLDNHRIYGKFKVRYKDGQISQPFSWRAAKDYAEIFGGEVIDNF